MIATEGPTFAVRVQTRDDDVLVTAVGEVDLSTAPSFRDALLRAVERATGAVVVDLHGVDYLDSTGVHCLYDAVAAAQAAGRTIRIERVRSHVARILRITGMHEVITVESEE